jgi:basic membrane lipoprotein Med (substrate-binding protein (PBP1-ABC) superfamily)
MPRVLFVAPQADAGSGSASALQATVLSLAESSGLQVVQQSQLNAADLTSSTRLVVALAPDPGLDKLVSAAPNIQFLAVGIPGVSPSANLSIITTADTSVQTAFLAGYIAALVTPDWRVGVVASTSAEDVAARDAFVNGARYLCGICNPQTPPYPGYPFAVEAAAGDVQTVVETLQQKGVQAVYVAPSLATPDMLGGLAEKGVFLVGTALPSQNLSAKWIATIHSDPAPALKALWADVLSGKGNQQKSVSLSVSDASAALSPGRMRLVDEVSQNLSAGTIEPKPVDTGP